VPPSENGESEIAVSDPLLASAVKPSTASFWKSLTYKCPSPDVAVIPELWFGPAIELGELSVPVAGSILKPRILSGLVAYRNSLFGVPQVTHPE
jgi:hypothetical protein